MALRQTKPKNKKPEKPSDNSFALWTQKNGDLMVTISDSKGKVKNFKLLEYANSSNE